MTPPRVRDARAGDSAAIAAIYNHAVAHTTASWNERIVDAADRARWITARQDAGFPVLVAEDGNGAVVGYGSFGDWRAWDGYRFTVEHSVYVATDAQRRGIGAALLLALIARARDQGKHAMIAGIEAGNAPSIALHNRLGFREVARMPQVGAKFGRWLDLVFLQLALDDRASPSD